MARKSRVHFPGALYHVISRGNQRQKIFRQDKDRSHYLDLLSRYQNRYDFRLYAYVLMSNHVHLLVEVGEVALAKVMQGLQQSYALYFNREYGVVGHLFHGRYKDILCDRDSYLLELVRYIHLNPVRSKLVKDPADYPWSSHRLYLGKSTADGDGRVQTEWILSQFSRKASHALRRYKEFVLDGIGAGHRENLYAVKEQRYLGDDQFVERVARTTQVQQSRAIRMELGKIEDVVCRQYDLTVKRLQSRGKERSASFGRALIAYFGQELGGIRLNEVAKRYGRDQVSMSLGLKSLRQRMTQESELRHSVENLLEKLKNGQYIIK
jgi:putative transposase